MSVNTYGQKTSICAYLPTVKLHHCTCSSVQLHLSILCSTKNPIAEQAHISHGFVHEHDRSGLPLSIIAANALDLFVSAHSTDGFVHER
jgi:hypothetical protein